MLPQRSIAARRSKLQDDSDLGAVGHFFAAPPELVHGEEQLGGPRSRKADRFRGRGRLGQGRMRGARRQQDAPIETVRFAPGSSSDETAAPDLSRNQAFGFQQLISGGNGRPV